MADAPDSNGLLKEQYADASKLNARFRLHAEFSTNKYGWLRWVFDHFDLPDRCRLLELGCGTGALWLNNRRRIPAGWDITLSDFSPGMLAEARKDFRGLGREFSFEVVDAQEIPFDGRSFDAVIANHMLYHVPDLDRSLGEIRRVLRPGGRLYAATNGAAHMRELRQLVGAVAPGLPFVRNVNIGSFSLENGAASLGRHFADVRLHCYADGLKVAEAGPLIDYVLSARRASSALAGEKVAELERIIGKRIASDGAIHITKANGMFEAAGRG